MFSVSGDGVSSLGIRKLKRELESYGISTRTLFDKESMIDAVRAARISG
jgi:hypothetical protein